MTIGIDLVSQALNSARNDTSEQEAAIERNIQATRRMVDAARDQPAHQLAGLREQAQLDAGSLRAIDARGERQAAAMDLFPGEVHAPIGASAAVLRAAENPQGVSSAGSAEPAAGAPGSRPAAIPPAAAVTAGHAGTTGGVPAMGLVAPGLAAPNSAAASHAASSHVTSNPVGPSPVGPSPVGSSLLAQSSFAPTPAGPGASLTPSGEQLMSAGPGIPSVSEDALAQAQVARRGAAIAATYRAFGEVDAAREIRARTRDLAPELAGEVVAASRATLEGIVSAFGKADGQGERIGRVERLERWDGAPLAVRPEATAVEPRFDQSTRYEHVATDLAAAMQHAGRGPRGEEITRDLATLVLDTVGQGDEYRLSAFALGVPFGTGLTLPLALAEELERRGERRKHQLLRLAMEEGLRRLQKRIAATVSALIDLISPLADLLAIGTRVDANDRDRLLPLLRDYADRKARFLSEFEALLRRVDAVGNDVFFVLDALRRRSQTTVALNAARNELLASPATAFAIAHSASALEAALLRSKTSSRPQDGEPAPTSMIQGARRLYAELGFSSARSALLAQATFAYGELPMEARWAVLNSADDLDRQSRLFEVLLRFFGAAAASRRARPIELSDAEEELEDRPVWGLPLFRSLEQVD